MVRVVIPVKYHLGDAVGPPTDGYTANEDWISQEIHTWLLAHKVDGIGYRSMTGDFYVNFKDDALAALFKLTFPP